MRRRDEWRGLLRQLRASGQGLKEFAEARGLHWRTVQHWKYVLGKEEPEGIRADGAKRGRPPSTSRPASDPAREHQAVSFVEVRAAAGVVDGRFEIELGGGRRVRVPPSFDVVALQRLLGVLEGRS